MRIRIGEACLFTSTLGLAFGLAMEHASAQDYTYTTNNGTITITRYEGLGGNVTIPSEIDGFPVTSMRGGAFSFCRNLKSITIPDSITGFGDGLPGGWNEHTYGVFEYCDSLEDVIFGKGATNIGGFMFSCCASLTNVTIPSSVTSIGKAAFFNCTSLTSVMIPSRVASIGEYAFHGCTALANLVIPDGVTNIEWGTFEGCSTLTNIVIPDSVTRIGNYAIFACTNLTGITIPDRVTSIGGWVLQGCTQLASITIPDSVTSIGDCAFQSCTSLTNITIPKSVTSIGGGAFAGCTNLTAIEVDAANPAYRSLDGVLFDTAVTRLVNYPGGKPGVYTIPNGVTSIELEAFKGCTSLTNVTIPNSVTSIGFGAFSWCGGLTHVVIPNTVNNIEAGAFSHCTNLTSVTIPNRVTSIEGWAFEACTSLTSVTIPNSVTTIRAQAFNECTNLTEVAFEGNAPTILDIFGDQCVFNSGSPVVYYLPGTTGWGKDFGCRPTAPWLLPHPVILTGAPNFGIRSNAFGFRISWAFNAPSVVEASTSLDAPKWSVLSTNTLTDGWCDFRDRDWANHASRFYRVRAQ